MNISGGTQDAILGRNQLVRIFKRSETKKDFVDKALEYGYDIPEITLYTLAWGDK